MSNGLWRFRGPVVLSFAAIAAVVLLVFANRAAEPPGTSAQPTRRSHRVSDGVFVSGHVTSSDGESIGGATVCAQCDAPDCPDGLLDVPQCTTTTASGIWELEALPATLYWLTAQAAGHIPITWDPGYGLNQLDLRRGDVEIDLVLPRGGVELAGTVVDVSGDPVAGALIGLASLPEEIVSATALSDEQGRFALWVAAGVARLEVRARGTTNATITASAPGDIRVELRPGATLTGRVLSSEDRTPMTGVHVGVGDDSFGVWRRERAGAVTNAAGEFEITGLAAGRYTPYASIPGRYGEGDTMLLGPLQTANVDVVAHPAHAVAGVVLIDGDPCEYGNLRLTSDADGSVMERPLDTEGRATLSPVLPGLYQIAAYCYGAPKPRGPNTVRVDGANVDGLTWTTTRGVTLRGVVVTSSGEPLPDVSAVATRDNVSATDTTRADGTFAISGLQPGETRVHAETLGVALSPETIAVIGESPAPVRIIARRPGDLALHIVDDDSGEPLAGFEVSVEGDHKILANSGSDGRTDLHRLAPGDYRVTVSHPVGGRVLRDDWVLGGAQRQISIKPGETTTTTIRVAGLVGALRGWVVDDEGDPVADAAVTPRYREQLAGDAQEHVLMFARHHTWRAITDEEGAFAFSGLIPGTYDLCAAHYSGGVGCVEAVATREEATIVMEAAGSLAGTATDEHGNAPVNLTLSARELTRGLERSQRFFYGEGHFLLDHLPAGTWELTAESNLGVGELTVTLDPGEVKPPVTIRLEPRATLTGLVVDFGDDRTLTNVEVSIWPEIGSVVGVRRGVTDVTGRFVLTGVPVGRAELRVNPPDGYTDFFGRIIEVPPGGGELGATRLVRSPTEERGMFGFRPSWPPVGDTIDALRVRIEDVKPDSPAGLAGLRIGDTVVAINGVPVAGTDHYLFWGLIEASPGTVKTVTLADGSELTMTAADYDWP